MQDGRLVAEGDHQSPACLLDGVGTPPSTAWSSDATRVLLGSSSSANAAGVTLTGFDDSNTTVTLSAPTGSATIGIDPTTHRLMHRTAGGAVSDISFLARTDAAIYQPAGKRIIAVGTDANGAYGIWLSTNTGTDPKQLLSVDDPTTPVTNLRLSADGHTLWFVHGFVHELYLDALALTPVGQADRQEDHLTVSTLEGAQAWTTGPCDATGTLLMEDVLTNGIVDVRAMAGSPLAGTSDTVQPVGWLYGYKLVFATRPSGCTGPADVWVYSPVDGFTRLAQDVTAASVRLPRGAFTDLPDVIEQAAPG
ncbi:MAG: hypothetical protein JWM34_3181 [Ilumatobacteraceae bacterium]|nr:hypothetical protein [Ilumatobacteraceae bacterium]